MRLTREELLNKHPIWNEEKHDIVRVMYGDDPLIHYDSKEYDKYHSFWATDNSCANIMAIDAYIYSKNGTYDKYRTLIGEVLINEDGDVLCGDIFIKYGGMRYDVIINNMYGRHSLDILRFSGSGKVLGFSNKDGQGSPSSKRYTDELKDEIINKVLNSKDLEDYGKSISKYIQCARDMYNSNKTNYIMDKTFEM